MAYRANNWGLIQMYKNEVERLIKVQSDLEEMVIKLSQLKVLLHDLVETNRTCSIPSSQFKIKHFQRGDLS